MNTETSVAMQTAHSVDAMAAKYVKNRLDAQGAFLSGKQPAEFTGWGLDVASGITMRMFPDTASQKALDTHIFEPLTQIAEHHGERLLVAGRDWTTHLSIDDIRPGSDDTASRETLSHKLTTIAAHVEPVVLDFDSFWVGNAFTIAALLPKSIVEARTEIREAIADETAELAYNGVGNASIAHISVARFAPTGREHNPDAMAALADWSLATHRFLQEYPLTIRLDSVSVQSNSAFYEEHERGLKVAAERYNNTSK